MGPSLRSSSEELDGEPEADQLLGFQSALLHRVSSVVSQADFSGFGAGDAGACD
jgi:hypothetical protein